MEIVGGQLPPDDKRPDQVPFVDIRNFGAVGDGKTKDAAAIQRALEYARKHNLGVWIPPGEYKIDETIKEEDS